MVRHSLPVDHGFWLQHTYMLLQETGIVRILNVSAMSMTGLELKILNGIDRFCVAKCIVLIQHMYPSLTNV